MGTVLSCDFCFFPASAASNAAPLGDALATIDAVSATIANKVLPSRHRVGHAFAINKWRKRGR
jgi:hypothetical protein